MRLLKTSLITDTFTFQPDDGEKGRAQFVQTRTHIQYVLRHITKKTTDVNLLLVFSKTQGMSNVSNRNHDNDNKKLDLYRTTHKLQSQLSFNLFSFVSLTT